jgi:hypothetical protein
MHLKIQCNQQQVKVKGFASLDSGGIGPAEACGTITIGDILLVCYNEIFY